MTSRLNTDSLISAIGVDLYDFDPLTGNETVHRFGTTEFVDMAGNAYQTLIADTGIALANQINDTLGGLQSLSWSAVAYLVNTDLVTDLINYNTLINNRLDIRWFIWDTLDGDIAEEITLYSGKIKSREFTNEIWAIRCEHIVTDLIQSFPIEIISPGNYPRTDPDNFGSPVPHVFGEMNIGPFDGEGRGARLAKCIDTAGVPLGGWLSSYVATVRGGLFEYNSGVWYEVIDTEEGVAQTDGTYDDSAGNITSIVSSSRLYRNYLGFATADSSLDGWEVVNDGRSNTGIRLEFNLGAGEFFEAVFNQSSDRGIIQSANLVIQRQGVAQFSLDWEPTLLKEGVSVLAVGDPDIVTDPNFYVHGLDITNITWSDLALLTAKLPSFDVEITQIYLEIEFLRKEDDTLPDIYQRITGYNFTNPIWQIYRILIEPTLCNIASQYIDLPSFQAAAEARDDWEFSFQISEVQSRDFVNSLNQECSSFLYIRDNKIACGVRTNIQEPVTAMIDTPDIRLEGQGIFCDFLPEDRIVNDVGLKFNQELASGKYFDILIASSLSRNDTPTVVTLQNSRWEAAGLHAQVGDKAFDFNTGRIHEITEAASSYIVVDPLPDGNGQVLYGPNLSAKSVRSKYGNRVSRSMGGSAPNFSELGAYSNAYISQMATARLWIDAILDGLAEPPLVSKLATYWKYALLYIGDTVLVDSPAFPEHLRPGKIGVTVNFIHHIALHSIIDVDIRSPAEIGDYLIVDYEVMKITGRGNKSFRVERAALDSRLASHDVGVDIRLFTSKFQVKNKAQNLNGLAWSYTIEQSVPSYIPRPYLGNNRGVAPNEPTQQELNSNFYVGSDNGLIHEPRPGLMSSGMVPYADSENYEVEEKTGGMDDTGVAGIDYRARSAVTVPNTPPVAVAGNNQAATAGSTVTLDGSGSNDPDGTIATYAWTQTAGDTVQLNFNSIASPEFTAPTTNAEQTLTFRLTVTDDDGDTDTDTVDIVVAAQVVANMSPTADAGDDQSAAAGVVVTLDGSISADPDGTIAVYAWAQTAGNTVQLSSNAVVSPTFVAPSTNSAQTLTFRLTVTDDDGASATDTVDITVAAEVAPVTGDTVFINNVGFFTNSFVDETLGNNAGFWQFDSGGSTGTGNTGPGTNNALSFIHTETTMFGDAETAGTNGIARFADVPDGTSRTLNLRLCIQGRFGDGNEGMEIQQRASDGDAWVIVGDVISGWSYGNSYEAGDTIINENAESLVCAEDGGWIDFEVDIPDSATQVRLHPRYIAAGGNARHDIAFRSFSWDYTPNS